MISIFKVLLVLIILSVAFLGLKALIPQFLLCGLHDHAINFVFLLVIKSLLNPDVSIGRDRVILDILPWCAENPLGIDPVQGVGVSFLRAIGMLVPVIVVENTVVMRLGVEINRCIGHQLPVPLLCKLNHLDSITQSTIIVALHQRRTLTRIVKPAQLRQRRPFLPAALVGTVSLPVVSSSLDVVLMLLQVLLIPLSGYLIGLMDHLMHVLSPLHRVQQSLVLMLDSFNPELVRLLDGRRGLPSRRLSHLYFNSIFYM